MDRRNFLLGTGVFLGLLGLGCPAEAKDDKDKKKQKKAEKPKQPPLPFVPGSWTVVILPDIQNYATRYPGLLRLQTRWIVNHKDERRIVYVLQNGDLTNNNKKFEWQRVDREFKTLDGVVPYAVVPGNHDYPKCAKAGRNTGLNDYFPPSRFESWPTFGGTMEPGHIENNFHLFEAGGRKWVIVGLEWGPRDTTLEWADGILKKYADRTAIVFTHAYLYCDNTRLDWAKKGTKQRGNPHAYGTAGGVNDGEEIWQKLIKKHANVFLMMNGHIQGDGLGFQVSETDRGTLVNEMAVDYQRQEIGGAAWLRLLEFLPDGRTVQARTYSPLYEEYKTDPENQFVFELY
ncbi:MAG: metallophosphoesterase [Pirellulales bacterium]|nr:metallophosphoesterase [Pirellulales bacterium]